MSSFSWLLSVSNTFALTSAVLLWPLSPHMIFQNVYSDAIGDSQSVSLIPGPSWGMLIGAWVLSLLSVGYVKGHVQCTSLMESGDKEAQEEARQAQSVARNPRTMLPVNGGDALASSQILVLQPEHLELEERRAQAAQWTREGYGANAGEQIEGQYSPTSAYARALPNADGAFPLASRQLLSSTMTTVQRPWHANEPIPFAVEVGPTRQQLEERRWRSEQERRAQMARTAPQSFTPQRRTESMLDGPFVSEPPHFLDASNANLRREDDLGLSAGYSFGVREDQDIFDLGSSETGLGQRDAVRSAYASPSNRLPHLPSTPYFTMHANSDKPVRVLPSHSIGGLDETFERAEDDRGKPADWGVGGTEQQQKMLKSADGSQASNIPTPTYTATPQQTRKLPRAQRPLQHQSDSPDDSPRISGPDYGQFRVLSQQYVKDSLQLDEAELNMLSEKRRKAKQQQLHQAEHDSDEEEVVPGQSHALKQQHEGVSEPMDASSQPSLVSQPLTPAQYRAAMLDDRERTPNLLTPAAQTIAMQQAQRPSRLPPLQNTLYRGAPFGASRSFAPSQQLYDFRVRSPSHSVMHHPFASELSPQRPSFAPSAGANPRVYHYGPSGVRSVLSPSESERDLHFASTRSQFQPNRPEGSFGATGTYGGAAGPSQLNHTYGSQSGFQFRSPPPPLDALGASQTPRFTLNDHHAQALSIDVAASSVDPFNRTIATPQPVDMPPVNVSYDPYANEPSGQKQEEDDEDLPLQQIPSRVALDGSQSAIALRGTPMQPQPTYAYSAMPAQRGPYSRQFGYY